MQERIEKLEEEVKVLKDLVHRSMAETSSRLLTGYIAMIDKPSIYRITENAVAKYYGLPNDIFYRPLQSGNRAGLSKDISDPQSRIKEARYILFSIFHFEYNIPILDLNVFFQNTASNYVRIWKSRYERMFFSRGPLPGDVPYYEVYSKIFSMILDMAKEEGLEDDLMRKLTTNSTEEDNKVNKWINDKKLQQ